MYAEVRVFDDDGTPFQRQPYYIPSTDINREGYLPDGNGYRKVHYDFHFTMCRLEREKGTE